MLVETKEILYLGAKKNQISKKNPEKQFNFYNFFDPDSQESSRFFGDSDSLDFGLGVMDPCVALLDIHGSFISVKQIMPVKSVGGGSDE